MFGLDYFLFVSSFHTSILTMGTNWKMPSMDAFIKSPIQEQDKIIKMGSLKNSMSHPLAFYERSKKNVKNKKKQREKMNQIREKERKINLLRIHSTPKRVNKIRRN